MYKYIVLFGIFFACLTSAYAEDYNTSDSKYETKFLLAQKNNFIAQYGDLPIGDIYVVGLRKTKKNIITSNMNVTINDKISGFDPVLFMNNIRRTDIFSDVSINYQIKNNKAIIQITAKDKWTLIPIPMVSSGGNSSSVGLIVFESNLFGLNKMLGVGFISASTGDTFLATYADPNILGSKFTFSLTGLNSTNTVESHTWKDDINYQEYKVKENFIESKLGYKFTSKFNAGISTSYENYKLANDYEDTFNPPEGGELIEYGLYLIWDMQKYYEYFQEGPFVKIEAKNHDFFNYNENANYQTIETIFSYSHKIYNTSRVKADILLKGNLGDTTPLLAQDREGGRTGFISLPDETLLTNNYANITLTYEKPWHITTWGMVTGKVFWEEGLFNGGLKYNTNDNAYYNDYSYYHYYAPGVGLQVYLKNIAIPALGISYAYNMVTHKPYVKFTAGFAF